MSRAMAALMEFPRGGKPLEKKYLAKGLRQAGMGLEEELLGGASQTALGPLVP